MSINKKIILATGGTGGHIFPAIALYKFLLLKGYKPQLIVDSRFLNFTQYISFPIKYNLITTDKLLDGGLIKKIVAFLKLIVGIFQGLYLLHKIKPSVVIGFGGYTTFPTIVAARILRKKIIIHEQNIVMGNANKLLSRVADLVATTFPRVKNIPSNCKTIYTGNFIREQLTYKKKEKFILPDKNTTVIFTVIGGSQGASVLSKVVPYALADFSKQTGFNIKVFHQARPEDVDKVKELYKQYKISNIVKPFFSNINTHLKKSHLIITRAGASTITDLIALGRPAILIPIPNSFENHQLLNAKYIADCGGGWLIEQCNFNRSNLTNKLVSIFSQPEILMEYSRNIGKLGRDGCTIILPIIENYCKN